MYLPEKDIIMLGSVCRSLNESSNDQYIWKQKSIDMRGKAEFQNLYKEFLSRRLEESKKFSIETEGETKIKRKLNQLEGKPLKIN